MTPPLPLSRAAEAYAFAFCATLKHGQDAHMLAAQTGFLAGAQFVLESAEVKALVEASELAMRSWGDYMPEYGNARKAHNQMRAALQHFRALAGGESK